MRHKLVQVNRLAVMAIMLCVAETAMAQTSASGSIDVNSLTVTPASGTIIWSGWTMNALSTTLNSDGAFNQNSQFSVNNPGTATASASVPYASANVSATANSMDVSSIGGHAGGSVSLPNGVSKSAAVSGGFGNYASFDNSFTLSQSTTVAFNLVASATQSLETDAGGQVLADEVILNLNVNGNSTLFYDNNLTLGPSSQFDTGTVSPTLSGSLSLAAGSYDLYLELDNEDLAVEATPEPSNLHAMLLVSMAGGVGLWWRRTKRTNFRTASAVDRNI